MPRPYAPILQSAKEHRERIFAAWAVQQHMRQPFHWPGGASKKSMQWDIAMSMGCPAPDAAGLADGNSRTAMARFSGLGFHPVMDLADQYKDTLKTRPPHSLNNFRDGRNQATLVRMLPSTN